MSTPGREVGKRENESTNNWHIGEKKVVKWKGCWYEKQSKTYILSCDTDDYFNFSYELLVITVNGISLMVL